MKRSRFSEEQNIGILREADGESAVKAECSSTTFASQRSPFELPEGRLFPLRSSCDATSFTNGRESMAAWMSGASQTKMAV